MFMLYDTRRIRDGIQNETGQPTTRNTTTRDKPLKKKEAHNRRQTKFLGAKTTKCPLQGFKPVCDGSVCLAWDICLIEGRNLLFRPDLSTRRNVSPGTEFIGFSSWDVVQLGWIHFHSPSGADNGAKDTFPFLIWGQPRRQYSSLNRRKPSRLSQWHPAVAKEQKPDAGPGDANSEYIKLKVVGNINSPLESQMAVYLIARDTIDCTYVADD
uniref:Uncharacterized protein n=1 Tax=Timema bartmani TaxID=61472 RepID=A0A7R9F3Z5_9NEOP|nr:unnamed protein product [Timema bartmani]